jgi:hypothetical protein
LVTLGGIERVKLSTVGWIEKGLTPLTISEIS